MSQYVQYECFAKDVRAAGYAHNSTGNVMYARGNIPTAIRLPTEGAYLFVRRFNDFEMIGHEVGYSSPTCAIIAR